MRGRARTAKRSQPRFFFTRERSESDGSVEPLFAEAASRETQPYRAIGMPEGDAFSITKAARHIQIPVR
jgi:hypothetical protein